MNEDFRIEPKWDRSKEQIWSDHFEKLTMEEKTTVVRLSGSKRYIIYYAAAAILLLLLIPLFYTREVVAQKGEHLSYILPDGSKVTLNAETELSYRPLFWFAVRSVEMNGEAYFEVEKGSTFSVKSDNGSVKVLGTRFNVISRGDDFSVSCISGKVLVKTSESVIIEGKEMASLDHNGKLQVENVVEIEKTISWRDDLFYFTDTPLRYVIEEISRQYNIEIEYPEINEYIYTGNFSKDSNIEVVLEIVGLPFGFKPEKNKDKYILVKQ